MSASTLSLILSGAWIIVGLVIFIVWAKVNKAWPFAPVKIREAYLGNN
jgi:hypothetical protein